MGVKIACWPHREEAAMSRLTESLAAGPEEFTGAQLVPFVLSSVSGCGCVDLPPPNIWTDMSNRKG